jgi:hypothetical protein
MLTSGRALAIPSEPITVASPARIKAATNRRESVRVHSLVPLRSMTRSLAVGSTLENSGNAPTGKYLDVAWACISLVSVLATCFPSELPSASASRGHHPTSGGRSGTSHEFTERLTRFHWHVTLWQVLASGSKSAARVSAGQLPDRLDCSRPIMIVARASRRGARGAPVTDVRFSDEGLTKNTGTKYRAHTLIHIKGSRLMWIKARAPQGER